jgi:hypothetical protein
MNVDDTRHVTVTAVSANMSAMNGRKQRNSASLHKLSMRSEYDDSCTDKAKGYRPEPSKANTDLSLLLLRPLRNIDSGNALHTEHTRHCSDLKHPQADRPKSLLLLSDQSILRHKSKHMKQALRSDDSSIVQRRQ